MTEKIYQSHIIEIKNVHVEMSDWLEKLIESAGGIIRIKEWQSIYNNYVCYNYQPFYQDGYKNNYMIEFYSKNHCTFVLSEYQKHKEKIEQLNRCYEKEYQAAK